MEILKETSNSTTSSPPSGGGGSCSPPLGAGLSTPLHHWSSPDRYGILKEFAKENRKNMTLAENYLWRQMMGNFKEAKFKRQFIIGDYIADFASIKLNLIIEVDGGYHSEPIQIEDDAVRTAWLNKMGWTVIRFTNEEVLYDIDNVLKAIQSQINNLIQKNPK